MNLGKTFKELCTPAMVYLAISIITIFVALFNGVTIMIVAVKAIFVLFWTFILNLLCKNGMKYVSWFLVLLPYVLIFIGILMNVGNKREGATNMSTGTAERAAAAAAAAAAARAAVAEINRRGQIEQQARAEAERNADREAEKLRKQLESMKKRYARDTAMNKAMAARMR